MDSYIEQWYFNNRNNENNGRVRLVKEENVSVTWEIAQEEIILHVGNTGLNPGTNSCQKGSLSTVPGVTQKPKH